MRTDNPPIGPHLGVSIVARRDQFTELLLLVARQVVRREAADVCCGDLTLEQYETIRTISRCARPTIGWLSAQLGVDLSTMSRNLTLLERNRYLSRARSAEDGRIVQIRLTPKGRRVLATLDCRERTLVRNLYDKLPTGQRPAVLKALQDLRSCLAAPQQEESGARVLASEEPQGAAPQRPDETVRSGRAVGGGAYLASIRRKLRRSTPKQRAAPANEPAVSIT